MPDSLGVHALGFSAWKRPIVRRFFAGQRVRFVRKAEDIPEGATVALWASGPFRESLRDIRGVTPLLLEDGFLRSVGLGADLTRPLSWIIDSRGIHYDFRQQSDLEHLLQTTHFNLELIERARRLRLSLIGGGLTKYNVGSKAWTGLSSKAAGREVVLVPGQVESDASLRCGTPGIRSNLELLRATRQRHPEAWIVYKPHPDVVAGLRGTGNDKISSTAWCDEVIEDAPMAALLDQVDTVHVMTSLTGFEALMRGKRVVCHGLPFYAGWGLTNDVWPIHRRARLLRLDELVAAALVLYPRYIGRTTGAPCTVEQAVNDLQSWKRESHLELQLRTASHSLGSTPAD